MAQTSALYGESIVSTDMTPDWYFVCTPNNSILSLTGNKTLQSEKVPLSNNNETQFWRFKQEGSQLLMINKGKNGGLNTEGEWDDALNGTPVIITTGGAITANGKVIQASESGITLGENGATEMMFVKAPVGGGSEWVQLNSFRTVQKGVTILYVDNVSLKWTSTDNQAADNQKFRFVFNAINECYNLATKTQEGKLLNNAGTGSTNVAFTTSNPANILIHPLFNRKGYVQFTLKEDPILTRIDYNSNNTLGFYKFNDAFGARTNDGFRIKTIYIETAFSDLNNAINNAQTLLSGTNAGKDPGQYPADARKTFEDAVNIAVVIGQNPATEEAQAAQAATNLLAAIDSYKSAVIKTVALTTESDTTWYYIVSVSSSAYCQGKVVKGSNLDGEKMTFTNKKLDKNMLWCFIKGDNEKLAIRNMATGRYMAADPSTGTSATPQYSYTIEYYTGTATTIKGFTIQGNVSSPMHAQDNGSVIVNWPVEGGNPSSLWSFLSVSENDINKPCMITSTTVQQGTVMTGIGNTDVPVLRVVIDAEGFVGNAILNGINGKAVNTSSLKDIKAVKAYIAPNQYDLNTENAQLLGTGILDESGNYVIRFDKTLELPNGSHYIWVTADIADNANEGNSIDLSVVSYLLDEENILAEANGNPANAATIFLGESVIFHPGDYNSRYYRIPAITTAKDGSLVAVCDRRWNSEGDLPNNIDVVTRRSTDNGKTWSDPITIAGTAELGGDYGHGDPAIITDRVTGDIIVLVTSRKGFFYGTPTDPPYMKTIISHDNGVTWEAPINVTDQVYGSNCSNPVSKTWYSTFPTSGAFMQTRDGSLFVAMPVREGSSGDCTNFIVRSDDHGVTWEAVKGRAATGANEAKLIERNNGDLLISVRHGGNRIMNLSKDRGATWGTQYTTSQIWGADCNGDMILYTSTEDGYNKNRLLHSIPWASGRTNVSVLISYDEGQTWGHRKTICARGSAYSALNILQDGTIGCFVEDQSIVGGFSMRFVRFSLDWLTDGSDTYVGPLVDNIQNAQKDEMKKSSSTVSVSGVQMPTNGKLMKGIYIKGNNKFVVK